MKENQPEGKNIKKKKHSPSKELENNEFKIEPEKTKEIILNNDLIIKEELKKNQDNFIIKEDPKDKDKKILNNSKLIKTVNREIIDYENLDENNDIKNKENINEEKSEETSIKSTKRKKHKKGKKAYDNLVKNIASGLVGDIIPEDNKYKKNKVIEII